MGVASVPFRIPPGRNGPLKRWLIFQKNPGRISPLPNFSRIGLDWCCLGSLPDPAWEKWSPERMAGFSIIPGPDFPAAAIELRACMLELRPSSDELRIPSISRSASIGNANRQEGITLGEGVPIARTPSNH